MRSTLAEWGRILRDEGEAALMREGSDAFLAVDPESVFNLPEGPSATLRLDRALFAASTRGEFHPSSPVFAVRQREGSVYSFVSVGRTENCDIWLPDDSVSKLHALLRKRDDQWVVQDAESNNGTVLNEAAVPTLTEGTGLPLAPGDVVGFGAIRLHFQDIAGLRELVNRIVPAP